MSNSESISLKESFKVELKDGWDVRATIVKKQTQKKVVLRAVTYGLTGDRSIALPLKAEVLDNGTIYVVPVNQLIDVRVKKYGKMPITLGKLVKISTSKLDFGEEYNEIKVISKGRKTLDKSYSFGGVAVFPDTKPPYFVIAGVFIISFTDMHEQAIGFLEWGKELFEIKGIKFAKFKDPYLNIIETPASSEDIPLSRLYEITAKAVKEMGEKVKRIAPKMKRDVAATLKDILIRVLK